MYETSSPSPSRRSRVVIQIGPDLSAQGGIAAVLSSYASYRSGFEQLGYRLIFLSSVGGARDGRASMFLAAWFRLIWMSLFRHVDVVHIHSSIRGSLLRKSIFALTCAALGRKYVMHIHSGAFAQYYAGLPRVTRALIRFVLGNAACVISLSVQTRDVLIAMRLAAPEKCRLVYNGIADPLNVSPTRHESIQRITLTFLGKLSESKGLVTLFEALAGLPQSVPPYTLFVGGAGDASVVSDCVKKYGLGDVVDYKGWIAGAAKDQLLADTKIFVLPSRSEGFPVAIVEAMAFGTAVLSTRIPGVTDAIRDELDGLLVDPGDVNGLRSALLLLLKDAGLRQRLGLSARQRFLDHFTIQHTANCLASIYDGMR
jgi:glycosyltransferase involved in cell wall biosynthesis